MDNQRSKQDAFAFLQRHKTGVVATVARDGQPHASAVHYVVDDDFNVYFMTLMNSRKYSALQTNPKVAFAVGTQDIPQVIQIEGTATDITTGSDAPMHKEEIMQVLNSNPTFYSPLSRLDAAESAIIWIKPSWVRWADYAFAKTGTEHIYKSIDV